MTRVFSSLRFAFVARLVEAHTDVPKNTRSTEADDLELVPWWTLKVVAR